MQQIKSERRQKSPKKARETLKSAQKAQISESEYKKAKYQLFLT